MAIDFTDSRNAHTYSGRDADASWSAAVGDLLGPGVPADVVDVGCGGGTYTAAWLDLGARSVTGVDSSGPILEAARQSHGARPGAQFVLGDAAATGLPDGCADLVFARALVHHLPDLAGFTTEAARLLRPGGRLVVQDRTVEDALAAGSVDHPRGWFFDLFPRLRSVEQQRRPSTDAVEAAVGAAGLVDLRQVQLWEVRRRHADRADLLAEIAQRTGRSILHELDDAELQVLVDGLRKRLPEGPVVEQDRWTLWSARLPDEGVEQAL